MRRWSPSSPRGPARTRPWDGGPPRAAAEQAAAKVASEEGIAATSPSDRGGAFPARRRHRFATPNPPPPPRCSTGAAARALPYPRETPAYLGDGRRASRPRRVRRVTPLRFHVDAREDRPRGFESDDGASGDEGENIDDGEGLSRRRVRRFRARTRRRRRRGRPRAISPGLARPRRRSLASRVASHLALATETTARDVRVGVVRPPRGPPLVFLLRAPRLGRSVLEPAHRARDGFCARSRRSACGAARGRSVAAMEEFSEGTTHAARHCVGSPSPAVGGSRSWRRRARNRPRAAARVGHARARARR